MITDHDQKIKGKIIILRTLSWIINNKCVPDEADGAAAVRSLRWRTHQMNNRNNHSRKMGTAGIAIWSRGGQSAHRARFFPFSFIFFYSFTCRQSMPRFLLTLSSPPSAGLIPRKILSIRIVRDGRDSVTSLFFIIHRTLRSCFHSAVSVGIPRER